MNFIKRGVCVITVAMIPSFAFAAQSPLEERDWIESRILRIALKNSERPSGYWDPAQRDCAGFTRYVLRTAAALPAATWKSQDGTLRPYVKAEELIQFNFSFQSRELDTDTARTGDLLVYYAPEKKPGERWHLMMLLKSPWKSSSELLAVYHNGQTGSDGSVRRVRVHDLLVLPHGEWRPHKSNLRFKGVYRWNKWKDLK